MGRGVRWGMLSRQGSSSQVHSKGRLGTYRARRLVCWVTITLVAERAAPALGSRRRLFRVRKTVTRFVALTLAFQGSCRMNRS